MFRALSFRSENDANTGFEAHIVLFEAFAFFPVCFHDTSKENKRIKKYIYLQANMMIASCFSHFWPFSPLSAFLFSFSLSLLFQPFSPLSAFLFSFSLSLLFQPFSPLSAFLPSLSLSVRSL
jgi:hypothetical protein